MKLYKYQGAGNDFILINNLEGDVNLSLEQIITLCDRRYGLGADGLILLERSSDYDFKMVFYNSDGSSGMMCGNGGRCIVDFARRCGLESFNFEAADGYHSASIISTDGNVSIVRLGMQDVSQMTQRSEDTFVLQTGADHLIVLSNDIAGIDIIKEGREFRYSEEFAPKGINVSFVEEIADKLHIRTYEKGVEEETYACGTGMVAASIAFYYSGHKNFETLSTGIKYHIQALRDQLSVEFLPDTDILATNIFLTGPATLVAECEV